MRKFIAISTAIILASFALTNSVFAALNAKEVWDVRTTGNIANGGFFQASPYTATPAAPSLSTTNGTAALNTYYCIETYTDAFSETKASAETSINLPDTSHDAIVVTSPVASTNAINYKVYCGTVSGGPYYIQNGSGTAVGTNYTQSTTPATSGDEPSRVDYSQQDTAQVSITDGVTAGVSTTITSVTGGFTQSMIGNGLYIASGTNFTVGWYEITSVTNSNTIVVDRNCATGVGATGAIKIGGAIDHPNTISASIVNNNLIYIKNGTYSKVGANAYVMTTGVTGGRNNAIIWEGYNSTHGDRPLDTNRPLFDGASSATNCLVIGHEGNLFRNLRFASATADNVKLNHTDRTDILFCKSSSAGDDGYGTATGGKYEFFGIEANNNTGDGVANDNSNSTYSAFGYFHDNSALGYRNDSSECEMIGNISESNSSHGFYFRFGRFLNNVAYNNTGASTDGFSIDSNAGGLSMAYNNVSFSNGRDGYRQGTASTNVPQVDYNLYNSNTGLGLRNVIYGTNDLTGAPSFTDAPNGDFTYSSGSAALGTGYPQSFVGATGDYQWNMGVDQGDHSTPTDVFGVVQ